MDHSLENTVVLVTGGAAGIGRECCRAFGRVGATVIVADRDDDGAGCTRDLVRDEGGKAESVHLDVAEEAEWRNVVKDVAENFGCITSLVNNAAIKASRYNDTGLLDTEPSTWDIIFQVNLRGPMLGARAVLPSMIERGRGSITMISATSALRAVADFATAYSSAKAGLNGLTLAIATTYGGRGIRCNAVAPGLITVDPSPSQDTHTSLTKGLVQRAGRPDDIASTVVFLSSEAGAYINGQVISVDGGLTAHMPGLSAPVIR